MRLRYIKNATYLSLILLGLLFFTNLARSETAAEVPKDVGLVERTGRTLVQLPVKIRLLDPQFRAKASHLSKEDFSIRFDGAEIPPEKFEVDNFCPEVDEGKPQKQPESSKHLLLYVSYMEAEGRENTDIMIRNMIPELAAQGFQMKILPNYRRTNSHLEWTSDVNRLVADLDQLYGFSEGEFESTSGSLENEIRSLMEKNQVSEAISLVEEEERAEQLSFEGPEIQLEQSISDMADLPMPKAMIYFTDLGYPERDKIVETAIRSGVPIYAVSANGMPPELPGVKLACDPGSKATTTLISLSEHTGGQFSFGHFKKNASDLIVKRIQSDLSCVYVVSIDASSLDRERTLKPKVRLQSLFKGKLKAITLPDITIPSEERRQEEAISMALRSPKGKGVPLGKVSVIPLGMNKSHVKALIQFSLEREAEAQPISTSWDVGVNYTGALRTSGYGSLRVTSPSPKVVFEKKVTLPIGPYSVVGLAHEVDGNKLARGSGFGSFNEPEKNSVEFLHPIDIMQWGKGTFVSEGGTPRSEDWISLPHAMANSDQPILFAVSLCRGRHVKEPLTIEERLLLRDKELKYSKTDWAREDKTPCRFIKDTIPAGDHLPGANEPYEVTYVINVNDESGKTVAETSKPFWIIGPSH